MLSLAVRRMRAARRKGRPLASPVIPHFYVDSGLAFTAAGWRLSSGRAAFLAGCA